MTEIDRIKRVVQESNEYSRTGENAKALKLLDESIAEAIRENDGRRVRVLSRHAAVISDHSGDLALVRRYCEQSLAYSPDDAFVRYSLADALLRQGQAEEGKQYAISSYKLSVQQGSERARSLVELILKRWPELSVEDRP